MATHDYNIANQSGADFRADLNNALSAILSNNASATEPTTTTAYMLWVDTANSLLKIRNSDDNAWITLPVSITTSNTVDIDGGTVNAITSLSFSSGETVTTILDEDDLSSDSASALATQQSIKAYVDSQVTAQDLDFQGDTGGALSIDLDSETFTISGGNGVTTSGSLNTLTIAIDSSVVTLTDTQTLTNKSIDADSNTISNLEVDNLKSGVLDTDLTSVSASDDTLASSKAIKTYVDAQVTAQDLDLTDGTTSISIDLDSEELSVLGGTGVTSTASGNGVTLAIGQDVGTTADVTFNTVAADLTGDVTGTVSSIANHSTTNLSEGTNLYYTTARFDSAFSGKSTSDLTEGTNLYFTDERVDDRVNNLLVAGSNVTLTYDDVANTLTIAATEDNLSNNTTDDLSEGSTNLYYTDARARAAISASGDLSYNSTTGVMSFTERTDAEVRGLVSASGDLSYNSTTGVFSFTERTDAEVRGLISASGDLSYNSTTGVMSFTERTDAEVRGLISGGTGVTYNNTTGVISIGQAVGTSDNVTFGDVIVSGDLTVSGTTTTVNTETINLADNIILFNSNATGTPTENAGIEIERGDATNKTLLWNETDDKWTVGSETFVAGTFEGALTGNVTGTVSSLANHDTDDLSEGATNQYFTTARARSSISASGDLSYDSATGVMSFTATAAPVTSVNTFTGAVVLDTDDISEGATNLYYTTARANSDFDTRLATKSTSDLAEGTNLYYTDARFDTRLATKTTDNLTEGSTNLYYADSLVDSHLSGGTGVTYSSGTISIGQSVGTGDSVTFAGVSSDFTGDIDGAVKFTAKADVALTKGQVVYISGISGAVPTVNLADADNASAMPAFGLVYANANANAEVEIITFGSLADFNTSGFSVGDTVYVSTTAGALTATPPTGESSLIQNIGIVQRSHASAGIIKVGGAGRTNATPNLNSGKIFYGNGSNQSVATTLDTSIVPESGNLYYTDARARSAISVSGNALSYDSGTGVITSNYEESPTFTGTVTVTGEIVANGGIALGDNDKATFGDSDDLAIYHDGSNSYVRDDGTGDLRIQATNLRIEATSGEDYLYCASDGAVTVYYDNAAKLATTSTGIDVTGTAVTDGVTVAGNLDVDGGTIKLDGNYPTGSNNVALGDTALDSIVSGGSNTAIGQGSLTALTTGNYNVGVGRSTLTAVTTTSNNVAVGGAALENNTGGSNTAVGDSALNANTSASNNTAVGASALLANTTGTPNTAVGAVALDANTTGSNNTGIGYAALGANTTASNNTALGHQALRDNATGADNTAVGYQALVNNTASNNTAVGRSALVANTTGDRNVAVGSLALDANTTADGNTAVGYSALSANTTGELSTAIGFQALRLNTGANNTAVGGLALDQNTTGTANVAVGAYALDANTTASYNTAVGYNSLTGITTGQQNTSIGYAAGQGCTAASSFNVAIGDETLLASGEKSYNTAVGSDALRANTTASNNTAVGYSALAANTTASNNTAVGYAALDACTTSGDNVAVGSAALSALTTATRCVGVGQQAGGSVTTGTDNTLIGYLAGAYQNAITTGSDNTVIGAYTRTASATSQYEVVLGRYALGQGSQTATLGYNGNGVHISITGSTSSWSTHSDERLKKDVEDSVAGLSFINDLQPKTFKWKKRNELPTDLTNHYDENSEKEIAGESGKTYHGFIAQEVKQIIENHPEIKDGHDIWRESPDGVQNLAIGAFMPMVIKSIQELSAKCDSLQSEINILKGE